MQKSFLNVQYISSILFFFAFILLSCSDNREDSRHAVYKDIINSTYPGEFRKIAVEEAEPIEITMDESSVELADKIHADLTDFEVADGYIYLTDIAGHRIIRVHEANKSIEFFGREGRGPGEFNRPSEINANSEYLFVLDSRNSRIQVFNKEMEMIHAIARNYRGFLDVTENVLLVPDLTRLEESVVVTYSADPPFVKTGEFMPRLVPLGEQPLVINGVIIRSDTIGRIYVSYIGLPFILVFDDELNHLDSIELTGLYVANFYDRPPERASDYLQREEVVRHFKRWFAVKDHLLFMGVRGDLIVIDLESNQLVANYKLRIGDRPLAHKTGKIFGEKLYLLDQMNSRMVRISLDMDNDGDELFKNVDILF